MTKYIFIVILISFSISQEMPGEPTISWMPTEYDLIDGGVTFTLSWNMWWGENGDHWRLYENSNNEKYEMWNNKNKSIIVNN